MGPTWSRCDLWPIWSRFGPIWGPGGGGLRAMWSRFGTDLGPISGPIRGRSGPIMAPAIAHLQRMWGIQGPPRAHPGADSGSRGTPSRAEETPQCRTPPPRRHDALAAGDLRRRRGTAVALGGEPRGRVLGLREPHVALRGPRPRALGGAWGGAARGVVGQPLPARARRSPTCNADRPRSEPRATPNPCPETSDRPNIDSRSARSRPQIHPRSTPIPPRIGPRSAPDPDSAAKATPNRPSIARASPAKRPQIDPSSTQLDLEAAPQSDPRSTRARPPDLPSIDPKSEQRHPKQSDPRSAHDPQVDPSSTQDRHRAHIDPTSAPYRPQLDAIPTSKRPGWTPDPITSPDRQQSDTTSTPDRPQPDQSHCLQRRPLACTHGLDGLR